MKFLCDNCKAKYQIGDDKVAGKTVRMKCRRCGFDIHVSASTTVAEETTAAPWPDASATMQGSMAIVTPELAASLGLRPATPAAPAAPSAVPSAPATPAAPAASGVAPTASGVAPTAPRAASPAAPSPAVPRAPLGAPRPPLGAAGASKPLIPRVVPAPKPLAAAPAPAPAPSAELPLPEWNEETGEEDSTAIMTYPVSAAVAAAQEATSGSSRPTTPATPAARALATPAVPAVRPTANTVPSARPLATTPRPAPAPAATPRPAGLGLPRPGVLPTRSLGAQGDAPRGSLSGALTAPAASAAPAPTPSPAARVVAEPAPPPELAPPPPAPAPAPAPAPPAIPSEGWYVGLGGSPFGPTSVTVLREKVRAGEISPESLVWRDGQGEWKPLRTFPGLLGDVVNSGNAVNAASLAGLAGASSAATPIPSGDEIETGPSDTEVLAKLSAPAPQSAPALEPPYSVSAFSSPLGRGSAATAVLTDIFPDRAGNPFAAPEPPPSDSAPRGAAPSAPLAPLPDPFAPPASVPAPLAPAPFAPQPDFSAGAPAPASMHAAPTPMKAPSVPDGSAGGFASGTGGVPIEVDEALIPKQRAPLHPLAYAFIAFAAVFGGVAAYVLLSKPPQQIVVVQAAPSGVAVVEAKGDKPPASAEVAVGEPTTDTTGAPIVRTGALPGTGGPRPKGSATGTAAPIDTSGFTSTIPGPSTAQPPPPSGAGGQLSSGEIQGVVAQNQAIVKRKCWQPALESRAANAPTNARVNGAITIGASGNVESASASGGERDFPGLSSCIASRMKGWKFPPSSSSTPVNVPFVFAGQ